jgi:hypothetical protein
VIGSSLRLQDRDFVGDSDDLELSEDARRDELIVKFSAAVNFVSFEYRNRRLSREVIGNRSRGGERPEGSGPPGSK